MQFVTLWPMARFHGQMWQFGKSASMSEATARRAKISSIATPLGRKRIYVQLCKLWPMAKFHGEIWQFLKTTCISETTADRVRTSSISTHLG